MFRPGPPRDRIELPERFRLGEIEVDRAALRAERAGVPLELEPKAWDLLLLFAANTGRVIGKEEIFERVWPGVAVSDNALTRVVAQLRRELGDDAERPIYLETIRTRGYLWRVDPEALERATGAARAAGSTSPPALAPPAEPPSPGRGSWRWGVVAAVLATAVLASLALRRGQEPQPPSLVPRSPVQLTVDAAFDGQPAISPDGATAVFVSERSGAPQLWMQALGSGGERQLTDDVAGALDPAFSPDGRWISYSSLGAGGIWRIPAGGGAPQRLTTFGSRAAWSPDGRHLAFQSQEPVVATSLQWVASRHSTIWRLEVATGTTTPLTRIGSTPGGHGAAIWSPDGATIVFVSNDSLISGLWRVPAAGGEPERLAGAAGWLADPVFEPSGSTLLALRAETHKGLGLEIVRIPLDGDDRPVEVVLPVAPPGTGRLSLSRDGRTLMFAAMDVGGAIERIDLDRDGAARASRDLLTGDSTRLLRPRFLWPDGRLVVAGRSRTGSRLGDLLVIDAAGTVVRELREQLTIASPMTTGELQTLGPGPDFAPIAIDPESGAMRPIPELAGWRPAADLGAIQWRVTPDLSKLVASVRRGERFAIVVAEVADPRTARTLIEDDYVDFAEPSAELRRVAFERLVGQHLELWAVEADGTRPRRLAGGAESWTGSWSPDASRHALVALRDGRWNVYTVAEDGSDERRLTDNRRFSTYYRYPDWSPTGDAIVVERTTTRGEIWAMTLVEPR
jgi:Tol biopolymer transport system component/DNA-binding winged helix-turn-helix (wHTH) protein